jgi:plastocyanin
LADRFALRGIDGQKPNSRSRIMRVRLSTIATLLIVAGTGAGCGGGGSDTGPAPGPSGGVLTTLEVTPATATLFTVAPGNTVTLKIVAKDQDGRVMTGASPTFSSDNAASADVSGDGTITAVAEGTSLITVSVTMGGVTKTGAATMTTIVAPASGTVTAPSLTYVPADLNVRAGATVTWTFQSVPHTVTFTSSGSPASLAEFHDASDSRVFPTSGTYNYSCDIHPGMVGVVHVH